MAIDPPLLLLRIIDRKPGSRIRAEVEFAIIRSHRIDLSAGMGGFSQIGERLIYRIIDKEPQGKHTASVDPAIRARTHNKKKSAGSLVLEGNLLLLFRGRILDFENISINEMELPSVRKASFRKWDLRLQNLKEIPSIFDTKPFA